MQERRDLAPIDRPAEIDPSWKRWQFPVRPRDPARAGSIDFVCPHCGKLLVEGTAGDVSDIGPVECPGCRKWSSGTALSRRERQSESPPP